MADCLLYLITPDSLEPVAFGERLKAALDAGPVAAVQLRLKAVDDDGVRRAVETLRPIAQSRGVAFLLNDRPDLAVECGCDGAHVGAEDMAVPAARKLLGKLQLGVSCYASRDLAMQAGEDGADYVAFGAFFPTVTKVATSQADTALLSWWSELMEPPVVAIGGINAGNCASLVQAGADFLAVVNAVWGHPAGEAAGVRTMLDAIAAAAKESPFENALG